MGVWGREWCGRVKGWAATPTTPLPPPTLPTIPYPPEGWEGLGSDRDGRGGNGVAIGFGSRLLPTLIPWDLSLLMGPWV